MRPAPRDHGIRFRRSDLSGPAAELDARWDKAEQTPLCTRLVNDHGTQLSTIEHLMAALAGLGITNARIDVSAPEVPILDGSAAPFVRKLLASGLVRQPGAMWVLRILKPVTVTNGDASATLSPSAGFHIDFHIDFEDAAIGSQALSLNMRNGAFVLNVVDTRAGLLGATRLLDDIALDRYSFIRDAYLARRLNQVYDGNPPEERFDEPK